MNHAAIAWFSKYKKAKARVGKDTGFRLYFISLIFGKVCPDGRQRFFVAEYFGDMQSHDTSRCSDGFVSPVSSYCLLKFPGVYRHSVSYLKARVKRRAGVADIAYVRRAEQSVRRRVFFYAQFGENFPERGLAGFIFRSSSFRLRST